MTGFYVLLRQELFSLYILLGRSFSSVIYCDMSARELSDWVTASTTRKRLHRLLCDRLDKRRSALGSDVTYTSQLQHAALLWRRVNSPRIPRYTVRCHGEDCLLDGRKKAI
jgi:hypothetical protein